MLGRIEKNGGFQPSAYLSISDKKRCASGSGLPWLALMERNTGHFVPDWDEKRFRQERIHRQSEAIVCKLESMGVPCRVSLPYPIMAIGELTGQAELTETRYRHMQMIPEVAQQDRRGFLRELTYFLGREAGSQGFSRSRYAVVTNGPRVPWYGDLRGETQAFNARIRRWSYDAARRFGIELLLRSNEHTFREMDGVHLHANIVYRLTRRLPKVEWAEFWCGLGRDLALFGRIVAHYVILLKL